MKDLTTVNAAEVQSMSSKEIAELTGKQHKNVIRDIREMLKELYGIDGSTLHHDEIQGVTAHIDERGYISVVYLDRSHSTTLVTGYSASLRKKVIDRWTELEEAARPKQVPMPVPFDSLSLYGKAKSIASDMMDIADLFDVPKHIGQQEAAKEVRKAIGVDLSGLLTKSPAQDDISSDEEMLEPTDFGDRFGLSGVEFNKLLAEIGLQTRSKGSWVATEKGKPLCSRHAWSKGHKSGYNLKWNVAKVTPLVEDNIYYTISPECDRFMNEMRLNCK